jgi:hypothetical protein
MPMPADADADACRWCHDVTWEKLREKSVSNLGIMHIFGKPSISGI